MAKATIKVSEIEARQYVGTSAFVVMNDLKGEMVAKKGDWLVGTEKGKIEVVSDAEFRAKYDLAESVTEADQEPVPVKTSPLVDPVYGAAPAKGIIEPTDSATRASQPTPTFVDDSHQPAHDVATPVKISSPTEPLPAEAAPV